MDPNDIVGLGKRSDFVAQAPGVDPSRLPLTPPESLMLQRVGHAARIADLLAASGLNEAVAIAALLSLRAKGAIVPAKVNDPSAAAGRVDAAAVEQVELTDDQKTEILARERNLDSQNHFEVLGIPPGAEPNQAKNAYYELSRRFHPDRFYGKSLGSFRVRVDRLFKRWTDAHQVLTQVDKRAAYLRAHPELVAPSSSDQAERQGPEPVRNQERKSRLARHPYLARAVAAHGLVNEGKAKLKQGEYADAYAKLQRAAAMDQGKTEAQALLSQTREKYAETRVLEKLAEGERAERTGKTEEALAAYRMVLTLDEGRVSAALRIIEILIRNAGSMDEAYDLACKAVERARSNPDAHVALGRVVLERGGDRKAARAAFDEALRLSPEHEEAKKQIKKIRWTF